jgi:hypothetical protein
MQCGRTNESLAKERVSRLITVIKERRGRLSQNETAGKRTRLRALGLMARLLSPPMGSYLRALEALRRAVSMMEAEEGDGDDAGEDEQELAPGPGQAGGAMDGRYQVGYGHIDEARRR